MPPLVQKYKSAWKQAAAMDDDQDSSEQYEKAFADQAYALLQQRLAPLLQPPFRLGFEVISSNSPENTRLVGVFAFRVNQEILLVPCCFIDGQIKGMELIYREKRKKFVPLSEDWADFLVSRHAGDSGLGVPRTFGRLHPARADLWRLSTPPNQYKSASAELPVIKAASESMFALLANKAVDGDKVKLATVLEDFVALCEDRGDKVLETIKLACEKSAAFEELAWSTGLLERFESAATKFYSRPKAASVSDLEVIRGVKLASVPQELREAYLRDGFYVVDRRKDAAETLVKYAEYFARTDVAPEVEMVHASLPDIQSVNVPGVYEILLADGSSTKARMFAYDNGWLGDYGDRHSTYPNAPYGDHTRPQDTVFQQTLGVTADGEVVDSRTFQASGHLYDSVFGVWTSEGTRPEDVTTGKQYLLEVNGRMAAETVEFDELQDEDGVKVGLAYTTSVGSKLQKNRPDSGYDCRRQVLINPDIKTDLRQGIVGGDALFWPVKTDADRVKTVNTLDDDALTHALYDNALQVEGVVERDGRDFNFTILDLKGDSKGTIKLTTKEAAVGFLCRAYGVYGPAAQDVVAKGGFFRLPVTEKVAQALPISPTYDPYWTQNFDSDVNVMTEVPQSFGIPTYQPKIPAPPQRLNDGWDPAQGRGALLSKTPMELYQFSREHDIPQLMDHGAVGEMLKVYDVGSLLDKMLPRLEEALDILGRLYFLIQWKPEEFADIYGDNDVSEKEQEFLSQFKSLGDVVLDLSKRSREVENNLANDAPDA